ncbi:hypothetical protein CN245_17825 [Sinorhizobium meliloti]|nr:hypothetical protein CN245_17825 [Sinorhizobium meliloti]
MLEAASRTRNPSPPRMRAMTFMRLWRCTSSFDGKPTLLSSMDAVTSSGFRVDLRIPPLP